MKTDPVITAALDADATAMRTCRLADLLADGQRGRALVWRMEDLQIDLSRQFISAGVMANLQSLARAEGLADRIAALFAGAAVNVSEGRAVIHMKQRSASRIDSAEFARLSAFADMVRQSDVADVINIGIGGSDLGPAMVSTALAHLASGPRLHYVSNVDPAHLHDVLRVCDPRQTLVIVTSKTFTTDETMRNAALARSWLADGGQPAGMAAVTAAPNVAAGWGIESDRIFDFDEGVGGRYSLWSAVGLPVMIDVGPAAFIQLLQGAAAMDRHFETAPHTDNLPVILGLLRLWNRNFMGYPTLGIMPYDQRLALLPAWLQQLEMESNGKSVRTDGSAVDYPTAPVIWGAAGTGCQHSFFQALHQGCDIIPLDIMVPLAPVGLMLEGDWLASHHVLVANAIAQAEALARGQDNNTEPHRQFDGGRPSTLISWDASTPHAVGRLLALYEHTTVVSGFLWGVNSFDQWGVELGKSMAKQVGDALLGAPAHDGHTHDGHTHDGLSATAADLLDRLKGQ